jgi:hypothetical protein
MSGCDCCSGQRVVTPRSVTNRPGLPRLALRVGTHGSFLASMIVRLTSRDHARLAALTTRSGDDAAIALLDGWATIADVLTFYQERIANEGYLRTAMERRSVLELGRLVDWMLRPGVSATAYLSYTVDHDPQDPGKDRLVTIPAGSRAQSVPDPGQLPQSFETAEDLVARAIWSRLEPRKRRPPWILPGDLDVLAILYLEGLVSDLRPGMRLVLDFGWEQRTLTIASATPDTEQDVTLVQVLGSRATIVTNLKDALRDRIAAWRTDPPGSTATAFAESLGTVLGDAVELATSLEALETAVSLAVQTAAEWAVTMEARGFHKVAAWGSGGILDDLEAIGLRIAEGRRAKLTTPGVSDAARADAGGSVHEASLMEARAGKAATPLPIGLVLGALRKAPSIPPTDSRALGRDPAALFGAGSDLAPQLLTTLDPRLAGTLYPALAGIRGSPPGLESVSAMRIKCQPFGASAPLRPVTDDRGIVTGSEEWPLDGEVTLAVRTGHVELAVRGLSITADVGDESFSELLDPDSGDMQIPIKGLGTADVEWRETGAVVRFGGDRLPAVTVGIELGDDSAARVDFVSDDAEISLPVPFRSSVRRTIGIRRYAAAFSGPTGEIEGSRTVVTAITRQPLLPDPRNVIHLDAEYEGILPESWIVIERPGDELPFVAAITSVATVSRAGYGITAKVTRLVLERDWLTEADLLLSDIREVTVFVLSQPLVLALEPVDDDICGSSIELQQVYPGLQSGRWIVVEGERADVPATEGVRGAELAMLAGVTVGRDPARGSDTPHTTITLAKPLAYCYRRATAVIHGNVARATHGETREEVLGSGDASRSLQAFPLRTKPLTYLADATPLGASSTLDLRVDTLRWQEARDLVTLGPRDRRYILRTGDAEATTVIFGTGMRGARPSTGPENVTARYRTGTGIGGNVAVGKISQLMTRPLGVSEVVNPLPSTGGGDRESLEQGRRNLPLGVLALDRLVSVPDYEDFARARAGIGQARATALSDGSKRVVHLTIAGSGDAPVDPSSDLFRSLRLALGDAGDPMLPVVVAIRELMLLVVAVNVRITDDRLWQDMEPRIRARLLERFAFNYRQLGQDVLKSELQAAIQEIPGVVFSDVDTLDVVPEGITPEGLGDLASRLAKAPRDRIPVELARFQEDALDIDAHTTERTLAAVAVRTGVMLQTLVRLNPDLAGKPLATGSRVVLRRGIRPAQIALLSASVPDTLILRNVTS